MLATQKQEVFDDNLKMLACLEIEKDEDSGNAHSIPNYTLPIQITCLSNLAHGADHKAGNATLFRRMQVLTTKNKVIELPYFAGNALRGTLRDIMADHFLSTIGLKPSRQKPPVELWFFQILYSGGMLEGKKEGIKKAIANKKKKEEQAELDLEEIDVLESEPNETDAKKVKSSRMVEKALGANGAVKISGMNEMKEYLPMISILGSAFINRIVPGKLNVSDFVPECKEWGFGNSNLSVNNILEWTFLTRRDDLETREEGENASMIATTETLKRGTVLHGGIDYSFRLTEIELSCLECALTLLNNKGFIGAESRRGFGKVKLDFNSNAGIKAYGEYLLANADKIKSYLRSMGALK